MRETPFEQLHHLVVVPVLLNGAERRFVLDSGIGLNLVRADLDGCAPTGSSFTGKRMSGQEVTLPLATVRSLAFADVLVENAEVGLLDMSGFPPELAEIAGFLSLSFFRGRPFTVDYERQVVRDPDATGTEIPVRVDVDGPAVTAFMPLAIPGGRTVEVELDMGSDALILDERFAAETGVELDAPDVRRDEGLDETGNRYARSFTRLAGAIHPAGAPELAQDAPEVMFQSIIHDGLLGHAFLSRHSVTWDLPRSRVAFARR